MALWVPIIHPCWSGSIPILVEDAAEPSRLRTSRGAIGSGSVIGPGSWRSGAAPRRIRWGCTPSATASVPPGGYSSRKRTGRCARWDCRLHEAYLRDAEQIAQTTTCEMGAPITQFREVHAEIPGQVIEQTAAMARSDDYRRPTRTLGGRSLLLREAYGVVAAILCRPKTRSRG
jgi:hypothetical protein